MIVVSNTSPILNLAIVGQLNIIENLYHKIYIPNFDLGLISFDDDGSILLSHKLDNSDLLQLGIDINMKLSHVKQEHINYLHFHRENIFQ